MRHTHSCMHTFGVFVSVCLRVCSESRHFSACVRWLDQAVEPNCNGRTQCARSPFRNSRRIVTVRCAQTTRTHKHAHTQTVVGVFCHQFSFQPTVDRGVPSNGPKVLLVFCVRNHFARSSFRHIHLTSVRRRFCVARGRFCNYARYYTIVATVVVTVNAYCAQTKKKSET